MARSDLLVAIVKAGAEGDGSLFRQSVEALIAEERRKSHTVLATKLEKFLDSEPPRNGTITRLEAGPDDLQELLLRRAPKRSLDSLHLDADVAAVIGEVLEEQHRADLLRSHGLEPRHRLLFSGPPGNGKTSLAEAIAYELGIEFFVVSYESLIASYLGETASRLKKVFEVVRTRPCVLFFDEFETLAKERSDVRETGEIKRVVSSLLLQIDTLPSYVVVVAATNHSEMLDRAVWRRFEVHARLELPSKKDRESYLNDFEDHSNFEFGLSPKTLAGHLDGASYSDLEQFVVSYARRYVLETPDVQPRKLIREQLKRWKATHRQNKSDGRVNGDKRPAPDSESSVET